MSGGSGRGSSGDTLPGDALDAVSLALLERHWRDPGFCVPNATTYPWQWLWDSCFHAVCWAHLDRADRAVTELANALAAQGPDGFVPHMTYWHDGRTHAEFWGRSGVSSITQPPMYGHAVAELVRRGATVPDELVERARRGVRFLLDRRRRDGVGPVIVHPWESGCDDSPRWDAWAGGPWSFPRWKAVKGDLVATLRYDRAGSPVANRAFEVASAGFSALVAFNGRELAEVTGDRRLRADADEVAAGLATRWDAHLLTWTDAVVEGPAASASVRTLDALLPVLVVDRRDGTVDAAIDAALDGAAYGGACGPAGTHRDEPAFDPEAYWRGPAWPQLTYLLWVAASRGQRPDAARSLARRLVTGATRSGFAEYWHPDTGEARGAVPQTWAALAAVAAGDRGEVAQDAPRPGQAPRA